MRLLVTVLTVLVGSSAGQQSAERVVSQARIRTGPVISHRDSDDPCRPSPCGDNTYCTVSKNNVAQCRCREGYVPIGNTINGCKTQCDRDEDCPREYRCQRNKCVRSCAAGACGLNAECRAPNHRPICTCPENYIGDPDTKCSLDEPEERVQPPAPYVSPCHSNPCGVNANCRVSEDRAVCSCPAGFTGDPLVHCVQGECTNHQECPSHLVCQSLECVDPCLDDGMCGHRAECRTRNHQPVCSCPRNYVGDARTLCEPFDPQSLCRPSPCGPNTNCRVQNNERAVCSCKYNYIGDPLDKQIGCKPECERDSDCRSGLGCRNNLCVNPCAYPDACGEDAHCDVRNNRAVCSCPEYYKGDPHNRCFAECTAHSHCRSSQACLKFTCADPCVGACGEGANCRVDDHQPICSCPSTHKGNPLERCIPFTDDDYCNPNPCGSGADCQVGYGRDGDKKAVCTCRHGDIGNPLISCQPGECERHTECLDTEACYAFVCRTPCYTLEGESVCGENADCRVKEHMPVCSCPRGYVGDPLLRCSIPDRSFKSSRYNY